MPADSTVRHFGMDEIKKKQGKEPHFSGVLSDITDTL